MKNTNRNYTDALEQRELVSEMDRCDSSHKSYKNKFKCYLKATKKSRRNKTTLKS